MNGKGVAVGLVAIALIGGAGLYYSLEYAYYAPVDPGSPAAQVELTSIVTHQPEVVPADDFRASTPTPRRCATGRASRCRPRWPR